MNSKLSIIVLGALVALGLGACQQPSSVPVGQAMSSGGSPALVTPSGTVPPLTAQGCPEPGQDNNACQ